MDLLADILEQAGLKHALLRQRVQKLPWTATFSCHRSLAFHVVSEGSVRLSAARLDQAVDLAEGDVVLLSRGFEHELSAGRETGKGRATVLSGHYQLWNEPVHPFFHELPPLFLVRAKEVAAGTPFARALALVREELNSPQLGSESVLRGLLDVLFNQLLRLVLAGYTRDEPSWAAAIRDRQLLRALTRLHREPQRAWSLAELAEASGMSRAKFARKFKEQTNDTPLNYLATLRVQRAMQMLADGNRQVRAVAELVGYDDPFVFSKVFKRLTGESPRAFQQRNRRETNDPRRFPADVKL